jgi:hypothetical protein
VASATSWVPTYNASLFVISQTLIVTGMFGLEGEFCGRSYGKH